MHWRASKRTARVALLATTCIGGVAVYGLYFARAATPSCSNANAISEVISIEKNALASVPFYAVFDFENTEFSLENIRAEAGDGYKLQCAATLIGDPKPKFLGAATEEHDAVVRQMFAAPIKAGLQVHYSVQYTEDGKLYVEVEKG